MYFLTVCVLTQVGVVHIVGVPSTTAQKSGALIHHTLGTGDFTVLSLIVSLTSGFPRYGPQYQCNSSNPQ
jgi:hypothetical protein